MDMTISLSILVAFLVSVDTVGVEVVGVASGLGWF